MASEFDAVITLPRLRLQNVNAISSPLTWGFPAPSAFTGFAHALERTLRQALDIRIEGVGIVCHEFEPQVYGNDWNRRFCLTRNPVDKRGDTAAISEEGRAHATVSLVLAAQGDCFFDHGLDADELSSLLSKRVLSMRIAGGSPLPSKPGFKVAVDTCAPDYESQAKLERKILRRCLPGFALVSRDDLLHARLAEMRELQPGADLMDAWLDLSRLNIEAHSDPANPERAEWLPQPKSGWLVPLPVGYGALSEVHAAGTVANARDAKTDFRFVESIYSVGQWISPHRINKLDHILWRHDARPDEGLYVCRNDYEPTH
jgi:CRISPR-associated protein Csy2